MDEGVAFGALQTRIGYTFADASLLAAALTHTSFVKGEGRKATHNERMEFLGDAVLEVIVSEHLYRTYPEKQEGEMTRIRARLVCEDALYRAAKRLGVPEALRLGRGEEITGGRDKPSVVSDAMEAVIGAVFLDGGMEAARTLVLGRVIRLLEEANADAMDQDYKTRLQELVQKGHAGKLTYELADAHGPEHQKIFTMRVLLDGSEIGRGDGTNKHNAGQAAARAALAAMQAGVDACG